VSSDVSDRPDQVAGEGHTVLLVDDEPDILGFMELALREDGYEVVTASSGRDALAVLDQASPSLILLDAKMPAMGGEEFLSELRRRPGPHVPVVLVTAVRMQPSEATSLGAQDLLAKPFDLDELQACVARHVRPRGDRYN
jgi:two-component system, chemotaxis family, chemotaxis protein CheY